MSHEMIEKFQCPGCVQAGTACRRMETQYGFVTCVGHHAGTIKLGAGHINLGLPKGFDKIGPISDKHPGLIRLHPDPDDLMKSPDGAFIWDRFNVPVWAMEEDEHLFVRTFSPRVNVTYVDVIYHGTWELLKDWPNVIDVSSFIDAID